MSFILQLEDTYDTLTIYDGDDLDYATQLSTLTGTNNSYSVSSYGNKMLIKFKTDGSGTKQGFSAFITYELGCGCHITGSISPACNSNQTCDCKNNVIGDKCTSCTTGTYGGFPNCYGEILLKYLLFLIKVILKFQIFQHVIATARVQIILPHVIVMDNVLVNQDIMDQNVMVSRIDTIQSYTTPYCILYNFFFCFIY